MRRKVELSLNHGPGAASKLELDAETTDPGEVTFFVEDLSVPSRTASGAGVTMRVGGGPAGSKTAAVRFTFSARATAGTASDG